MFAHKVFKLLSSQSLALFFINYIIVMFHYFLNRTPKLLDHFGHIDSALSYFMLHIFQFLFLFEFFLMQLFFACSRMFPGVSDFLFGLSFEVLSHPFHFLDKVVPMVLLSLLLLLALHFIKKREISTSAELIKGSCPGADCVLEIRELGLKLLTLFIKLIN